MSCQEITDRAYHAMDTYKVFAMWKTDIWVASKWHIEGSALFMDKDPFVALANADLWYEEQNADHV